MTYGNTDSDVVIEIFSDVECPACATVSPQVKAAASQFRKEVQLKYYHYPLPYHSLAFPGAEATECARDQGKGWEYLEGLYKNQQYLSEAYFTSLAKTLELKEEVFAECLSGHHHKDTVMAQYREGQQRSIPGTPTIFVNGEITKWPGQITFEAYLKSLID